jgi:hypothetical protein
MAARSPGQPPRKRWFADGLLDTILGRLALLFLAGADGDLTAVRDSALRMLAAYHPETEDELRLAAEIVCFSLHALEALGQAANPDMPLTKILRLRSGAVNLSREAHKAQRKLDQIQRDRRAGTATQTEVVQQAAEPSRPQIETAIALIEATREEAVTSAPKQDAKAWTQSSRLRQMAQRITENMKKNQAPTARHSERDRAARHLSSLIPILTSSSSSRS